MKLGGGRVHYWSIIKALRQRGHDVWVVAPLYGKKTAAPLPETHRILFSVPGKNPLGLYWFEMMLLTRLPYLLRRYKFDVLLVRGGGPAVAMGLVFLFARLLGIPVALECNGITWEEFRRRRYGRAVSLFVKFAAWQQAMTASVIIGVTRAIAQRYSRLAGRRGAGIEIPNGVFPEDFADRSQRTAVRRRLGIPQDAFVIGFVGSFTPWHGTKRLIAAMTRVRDMPIYLLMVGAGGDEEDAKQTVRKHDLDRVVFTGSVGRDEISEYYQAMDVGTCLNTEELDGSPLKFFEYLAAGVPILGSGFPQIREIINQHNCGMFLEECSEQQVAQALRHMYGHRERYCRIGQSNQRLAESTYSWVRAAEQLEKVFVNLCNCRSPGLG